jgi:uncharacterized protein (TIGR02594 family)
MVTITASVGSNGTNHKRDVLTVQHLLNTQFSGVGHQRRLDANGTCCNATIQAIVDFERRAFGPAVATTGLLTPHCAALQMLVAALGAFPTQPLPSPGWLKIADDEARKGTAELPGLAKNSPRILDYIASYPGLAQIPYRVHAAASGHMMGDVDETPWCACFVNWCLLKAGKSRHGTPAAASFRNYGHSVGAVPGAVTVIYRKLNVDSATGWHVGFRIGGPYEAPVLLGGNQDNRVCRKQYFDLEDVVDRWPI